MNEKDLQQLKSMFDLDPKSKVEEWYEGDTLLALSISTERKIVIFDRENDIIGKLLLNSKKYSLEAKENKVIIYIELV